MTKTETITTITLDSGNRYFVEHNEDVAFVRRDQADTRNLYRFNPATDVIDTIKFLTPIMIFLCLVAAILYRQTLTMILMAVCITLLGGAVAFCIMLLRSWRLSLLLNIESKRTHTISDMRGVLSSMIDRLIDGIPGEPLVPMHIIMSMSGGVQARALDHALREMRVRWNHGKPQTVSGESQTVEEFRASIMECYDMVIDNARRRAHDSDLGAIAGEPWNSVSGVDQRSFVAVRGDFTDEEAAEKAQEAFATAPEHR